MSFSAESGVDPNATPTKKKTLIERRLQESKKKASSREKRTEPSATLATNMDEDGLEQVAENADVQKSPSNYLSSRKPSFSMPASPKQTRTSMYGEAGEMAPKIPHIVDTQLKMTLLQILPIVIAAMAQNMTSIQSCGCSFCACFNIYAEFFRMLGYISLVVGCFKFKDMILDQRHRLLDGTQHVELDLLGKVCLGHSSSLTAETLADFVLGRDRYNMCWPRGPVFFPFVFTLLGAIVKYTYETMYPVLSPAAILAATFFYVVALGASFFVVRSTYIPYMLICKQVGEAAKDRIGLWDKSEISLREMQKLSVHATITGTIFAACSLASSAIYGIGIGYILFFVVGYSLVILMTLVAPVLPIVNVLKDKKTNLLVGIATMIEVQNEVLYQKFADNEDESRAMAALDNLIVYEKKVKGLSVYPAVVKWVYTAIGTFFFAILPIALALMASLRESV